MKTTLLTILLFLTFSIGYSQDRTISFTEIVSSETQGNEFNTKDLDNSEDFTITFTDVNDESVFKQCTFFLNEKEKNLDSDLSGNYNTTNNSYLITLTTLIAGLEESSTFKVIKDSKELYSFDIILNSTNDSETIDKNVFDFSKIPLPRLKYYEEDETLLDSKKNRYLVIDATPDPITKKNNTLYKKEKDNSFKISKSVPVNSSLAFLIKNYSFINIEETSVNINGTDYSYAEDVGSLYEQTKAMSEEEGVTPQNSGTRNDLQNYLEAIFNSLESIKYMNINDLQYLQSYQDKLGEVIAEMDSLTVGESSAIVAIRSWRPDYVSISPIALTVPDADEVNMTVTLKYKGNDQSKEYDIGTYRTSGGLAVGVNSNIYITGLKNNKVYSDSIMVNGTKELRARMDTEDQLSIGIGMNSELSFRTGSIVKPTINVGFFIPIGEEDLSPFLALGPGFSIGNKKVKFSLSGGWAFGKVNAISERYKDKDLSQFGTIEDGGLTEKVWKSSWQIGIGLSYNLTGN